MKNRLVVIGIISLIIGGSLIAGTPVISEQLSSPTAKTVRLMEELRLGVYASDPNQHQLMYQWSITNDPTAKAYFISYPNTTTTTVVGDGNMDMGFPWINENDSANLPFVNQVIQVVVTVNHANPLDGTEFAIRTFSITITGINHPPVPVISGQLGSVSNRIPSGAGVICSAGDSTDQDLYDSFRADWFWGTKTGGSYKYVSAPLMFGSEGTGMSFTVPEMTSDIDQGVILQLTNGLHRVSTTATAYLKPSIATPPPGNSAPVVTVTTPVNKIVGDTLVLNGVATDADGDDLQFSWVWLQTGATVAASAVNATPVTVAAPAKKWNVTANLGAIPTQGTFQARLVATERLTTDHKSGAAVATINVTQSGGNPPPEQPIETITDCIGNTPPTVSISPSPFATALKYTGGQTVTIVVTATDASVFNSPLGPKTGATVQWETSQLGVTATPVNNAVGTTTTSTLTFTAPTVNKTATITVTAADQLGCQKATQFPIVFETAVNNQPPVAVVKYKVGTTGTLTAAPATPVAVNSPTSGSTTITLDGSSSTDDGGTAALTYLWTKSDNLSAGGVTLTNANTKTASLSVNSSTQGTVTLTLKVTDQPGLNSTATISFNITNPNLKPTANVVVKAGTTVVTSPVEEGTVITLDGSGSTASNGSKTHLTYAWHQLEGPPVSLIGMDSDKATFVAPAVSLDGTQVEFELSVTDTETGGSAQKPATVTVNIGATYFAQVGFGALGQDKLQSVLLLVNHTAGVANGVTVEFFGSDGQPLQAVVNGQPWTSQPFSLPVEGSRKLEFGGVAGADVEAGWARVKSSTRLDGLVQYQVLGSEEEAGVKREISVFPSRRGRNFATYFNASEEIGLAIANPTNQPVSVRVKLINSSGVELANKLLFGNYGLNEKLVGNQHRALFVDPNAWFGLLPGFQEGTLILEADGEIIVTVIKTKQGVIFSALPLATAN